MLAVDGHGARRPSIPGRRRSASGPTRAGRERRLRAATCWPTTACRRHGRRVPRLVRPSRRPADRRDARRACDAGGEAGPVHSAGLKLVRQSQLAGRRSALRLDRGLPDRGRCQRSGRSTSRSSKPTSSAPSIRARRRPTACRATSSRKGKPSLGEPSQGLESGA